MTSEPGTDLYLAPRRRRSDRFTLFMIFTDAAADQAHGSSEAVGAFTAALYPLYDGPVAFERFELGAGAGA